jgi:hypothetical protein
MDFLKKNYEKILLGAVLLGLALAAAGLPFALDREKAALEEMDRALPRPILYAPINLATQQMALARMKSPPKLVLAGQHNTFNPVVWKLTPKGDLVKLPPGSEGAEALKVTAINPLMLEIRFNRATGSGYFFTILREVNNPKGSKQTVERFVNVGVKSEAPFILKELKAAQDGSQSFVIELADTKEIVTITKEKPYSRIDGYSANLRYELENKNWLNSRAGEEMVFDGARHKIIEITSSQVRIQSISTQKQTTLLLPGFPK